MTFVQIGEFDWLSAWQKGSIFVKTFKKLLPRNHKNLAYMLRTLASTKVVLIALSLLHYYICFTLLLPFQKSWHLS